MANKRYSLPPQTAEVAESRWNRWYGSGQGIQILHSASLRFAVFKMTEGGLAALRMTGEVWLRSELQWTNLVFVLRSVDCQRGRERQIRLAASWAVDYGDEGVQLFAIRASAEDFDDVGAGF